MTLTQDDVEQCFEKLFPGTYISALQTPVGWEVSVDGRHELSFVNHLVPLSEFFGTRNIDIGYDSDTACSTCGPSYETTFRVWY